MNLTIKVKRLTPTAILPTKSYENDMGWDLYADGKGERASWTIPVGDVRTIGIGLAIELPKGWGAFLKARSSQGKSNIDIYGGVQDNGYRGEYGISIHNSGPNSVTYRPGDRIAQMVLIPSPESVIVEVDELSETDRGVKGFGSTGK